MQTGTRVKSLSVRIKEGLVPSIFGILFTAIGFSLLAFGVLLPISDGLKVKGWKPASAYIENTHESRPRKAAARYRYEHLGVVYYNTRVDISRGGDNVGVYHANMNRKLTLAAKENSPVDVWINPKNPAQSILDRRIRWKLLAGYLTMAFIFGGIGLLALSSVLFGSSYKTENRISLNKPWLTRPEWANKKIKSNARATFYRARIFALVWCFVSLLIISVGISRGSFSTDGVPLIFLCSFTGIGFVVAVIKATIEWRRFGHDFLIMDPYPAAIGGQLGGTLNVKIPYDSNYLFKVTLNCLHRYTEDSKDTRVWKESSVWQSQGFAYAEKSNNSTQLSLLFNVDDELPSSGLPSDSYYFWQLRIEASISGIDFNRTYNIPVFKHTGSYVHEPQYLRLLCVDHPAAKNARKESISHVLTIHNTFDGVVLDYPAFKYASQLIVSIVVCLLFMAIGIGVGNYGSGLGAILFGLMFSLPGLFIPYAIYLLLLHLQVRVDNGWVNTAKIILGIRVGGQRALRKDISHLCMYKVNTVKSRGVHMVFYEVHAITLNNEKIVVGRNFVGKEVAAQALEEISVLIGAEKNS